MKILLIITDYGSFNNFLAEVAAELVKNGHEVHVICSHEKVIDFEDKYSFNDMGIRFHYITFPRSFNPFKQLLASKKINRKITEIDPYLINVHFTTGIFTTLLWRKPACFVTGTIHGLGYPMISHPVKKLIFKTVEHFCFKRLDQICLLNESDFELVKLLHPQKAFQYQSFGVGNDLQKFNREAVAETVREEVKKSLFIKADDFVLVFTGRFAAFKGFNRVIKAFNSLVNDYHLSNIRLIIIGGKDPIHTSGLSQRESQEFLNNEQIIDVGFTADVNLYLSIADLFVFPSIKEGMPVCIMEALSMGVPVITSDSRGCSELISHNFNGLLLSDNPTVSETREAILKLYRNRELLQQLSANAVSKREEFSRQKYVKNQIDAYQSVNEASYNKSA